MIFVTVGTHEQPFDRLVKAIDELVADGKLEDEVFIQAGYCTYEPRHCEWVRFVPTLEMRERMEAADAVVTHGGPSSFIEAMAAGKVPIVVPRRVEYGEHVNNHQVEFVRLVAERQGGIVPVYEMDTLHSALDKVRHTPQGSAFQSHNLEFCTRLRELITSI
ncbi:MAG TPA: beta(1,3)galactosyltransferase EpsH [Candidatus Collinsella stercoripullorum]|nr:beta(1,3)galactosyltransferase EpsH [Candidatus Collinsella stercoripullorum]